MTQNDVIATGIWSALYGSHELNISPSNRGSSLTGHLASVRRRRGERDHIFALGLSCKVPETKKGKKKKMNEKKKEKKKEQNKSLIGGNHEAR